MGTITPQARDLLIRTIIGEAQGEGPEGWQAVANVILNRTYSGHYGRVGDLTRVVTLPGQFAGLNTDDARNASPDDPIYKRIGEIVDGLFSGQIGDNTGGADHFYAPNVVGAPSWAQGQQGQRIGNQLFYRLEGPSTGAPPPPPTNEGGYSVTAAPAADSARAYLASLTDHPTRAGDTANFHPDFAQRLATAIKQANDQGMNLRVGSGFREPGQTGSRYDAGGNSSHSYGLAADIHGLGYANSPMVQRWKEIAKANGLHNPYGIDDPAEFNHVQLPTLPLEKTAGGVLDRLKAAKASGNMQAVWNAYQAADDQAPQAAPQTAAPSNQEPEQVVQVASSDDADLPAQNAQSTEGSGAVMAPSQGGTPMASYKGDTGPFGQPLKQGSIVNPYRPKAANVPATVAAAARPTQQRVPLPPTRPTVPVRQQPQQQQQQQPPQPQRPVFNGPQGMPWPGSPAAAAIPPLVEMHRGGPGTRPVQPPVPPPVPPPGIQTGDNPRMPVQRAAGGGGGASAVQPPASEVRVRPPPPPPPVPPASEVRVRPPPPQQDYPSAFVKAVTDATAPNREMLTNIGSKIWDTVKQFGGDLSGTPGGSTVVQPNTAGGPGTATYPLTQALSGGYDAAKGYLGSGYDAAKGYLGSGLDATRNVLNAGQGMVENNTPSWISNLPGEAVSGIGNAVDYGKSALSNIPNPFSTGPSLPDQINHPQAAPAPAPAPAPAAAQPAAGGGFAPVSWVTDEAQKAWEALTAPSKPGTAMYPVSQAVAPVGQAIGNAAEATANAASDVGGAINKGYQGASTAVTPWLQWLFSPYARPAGINEQPVAPPANTQLRDKQGASGQSFMRGLYG